MEGTPGAGGVVAAVAFRVQPPPTCGGWPLVPGRNHGVYAGSYDDQNFVPRCSTHLSKSALVIMFGC